MFAIGDILANDNHIERLRDRLDLVGKEFVFDFRKAFERLDVFIRKKPALVGRNADIHRGAVADAREILLHQVFGTLRMSIVRIMVEPARTHGEIAFRLLEKRPVDIARKKAFFPAWRGLVGTGRIRHSPV